MFLKMFLLFLLAGSSMCQFFTNGRYGKRSGALFADDQVAGTSFEAAPVDLASLPRLSCVYTGYQTLYNCHRASTDGSDSRLVTYGR